MAIDDGGGKCDLKCIEKDNGSGGDDGGLSITFAPPPGWQPTLINPVAPNPYDVLWSLLPFTGVDLCNIVLNNPGFCNGSPVQTVGQYFDNPPLPSNNSYDFSAFGFGGGGQTGANPGSFAGGIEGIHFIDNNENDLFYYGGPAFLAGGEVTAGLYAVFGYNMYDYHDYSGISRSVNVTAAFGHGVTIGYFWSGEKPLADGVPQGFVIGYAYGAALSVSYSEPEYHPLLVGGGY